MQKNNQTELSLKSYLDLKQLLSNYRGSHEDNRVFALKNRVKQKPLELLLLWSKKNLFRVKEELVSSKYLHYLSLFSTVFGIVAIVLGILTGVALLSYSGAKPVNVIYLLLVMVGLPLLSMLLSLFSMLFGQTIASFFRHLSLFYYLEKVVNLLPFVKKESRFESPLPASLNRWLFLQRVQLFSLLFSLGVFLAFVLMIVAKDIAFGWSTTLQITPEAFHTVLVAIATPWQHFLPSAVPSLALVELSHYFRLGEKLDTNMIQNADKLGAWWKFLAMSTLFYALFLRLIFWLFAHLGFKAQLKKEFLALEGVSTILGEFERPFVSTQSPKEEQHLALPDKEIALPKEQIEQEYDAVVGWNFSNDALLLVMEHFNQDGIASYVAGGKQSFKEDQQLIDSLKGSILLYVKAWEPPTMDFVDFLEELIETPLVKKVEVFPIGTSLEHYRSRDLDVEVWLKKLKSIDSQKLGVVNVK